MAEHGLSAARETGEFVAIDVHLQLPRRTHADASDHEQSFFLRDLGIRGRHFGAIACHRHTRTLLVTAPAAEVLYRPGMTMAEVERQLTILPTAAIAGQGLIYQPTFFVADDLRAGTLVAVTLDHPTIELGGVYAVYLPDRNPPAKVRAFIDFVAERFGPEPPWERAVS